MAYLTENEYYEKFEYFTSQVESMLLKGENLQTLGEKIPFAMQLNDSKTLDFVYTNNGHTKLAGHHVDEIREMGEKYLTKYIHPASLRFIAGRMPMLYSQKKTKPFSFVQYARIHEEDNYSPVITFTKSSNLPDRSLISFLLFSEDFGSMSPKMEQIVEIDQFKLKHFKQFQQLTERELEILKYLAKGFKNAQIADQLFISRHTVNTHRKHINRKLEIGSCRDLVKYALSFNLVEF